MERPPVDFDTISEPLEVHVSTGLAKIGAALKARAWKGAGPARLTPTQGQALTLLRGEPQGLRLSTLARSLAITPATASDAVASLTAKGFVVRGVEAANRRAAAFALTPEGAALADEVATWPDFLARATGTLDASEQTVLYRALVKMIRALQEAGDIPVQRMCVSCRYFRPNVRPDDPQRPHVCAFVGAPFGDRHLRLDCREQEQASAAERDALWRNFAGSQVDQPHPTQGEPK